MKNTLAVIAGVALLGAVSASAQTVATIAENNYGVDNKIIMTAEAGGGDLPADAWIQVLAGPAGGALTAVGSPFQPSEPGYFDNGIATIPGITGGAQVDFQVQAWVGTAADGYSGSTIKGASLVWTQTAGSLDTSIQPPPAPTGPDMNMPAFSVGPVVPEPSTLVLGALGAAALLIRRRK